LPNVISSLVSICKLDKWVY